MARLLSGLQSHHAAWPFLQPINPEEVPDYYDVIKNPMDLGTMEQKLNDSLYPDLGSFVSDANLVFTNCIEYHNDGSIYCRNAAKLKTFFNKQVAGAINPHYDLMARILSELQKHSAAWPFLQRVDPEVTGYYDVIKNPMDFGTMERKLDHNQYLDLDSFILDANLVFSNSMFYNRERSVYFRNAVKLKKFLDELVADGRKPLPM